MNFYKKKPPNFLGGKTILKNKCYSLITLIVLVALSAATFTK
jgi:hypothetical protein